MASPTTRPHTAASLRGELNARNRQRAASHAHELTYGQSPSVVYQAEVAGGHGNFLDASYRRIVADGAWRTRLQKAYTASGRVPRAGDRERRELDCACSSDALLMNIFCYPRITARPQIAGLMGVDLGVRPEFGVRVNLRMRKDEIDRTEIDMRLGTLLFEAKLTETGFQRASRERLLRYVDVEDLFDIDELPWAAHGVDGYQLIRGVLAAEASGGSFVLLCDGRRTDLVEIWFRVLRAVRSFDLRSRMALVSWQEIAAATPQKVQTFLAEKYGIVG